MIQLNLQPLLERRGKSFYWLAKETGINHSVMTKLRHNRVKAIRLDVLDKLCAALDCPPGDLLVRIPSKKGEEASSRP